MDHTPSPTPDAPPDGPSTPGPDHPDLEREEGPGKDGQTEQPEIRHVPEKPEVLPVPEHLKN
jgi:hypothetical protein